MGTRGEGVLRAANPTNSGGPLMNTLDSADIPLVFPPEDQVRNVTVTVVEGLPYGLIIEAPFLRQNGNMINLADGGSFKLTLGSPWVSFVATGKHQIGEGVAKTPSWQAKLAKKRGKRWGTVETPDKEVTPGSTSSCHQTGQHQTGASGYRSPSHRPGFRGSRMGRRRHPTVGTILR